MANSFLKERLASTLDILNASYRGTASSASAVKGEGRSKFVKEYLEQVIPKGLRIDTHGQITDSKNNITGELDIVIENGQLPNFPLGNSDGARYYFAEGVAAVIEVKSNLSNQWAEVLSTGSAVSKIEKNIESSVSFMPGGGMQIVIPGDFSKLGLGRSESPMDNIRKKVPYFVVGYTGWTKHETIKQKLLETPFISGILQLDIGYYCANASFKGIEATGSMSLLGFIDSVYTAASHLQFMTADLTAYARN